MELEKSGYQVQQELYHSLHSTIYRALAKKSGKSVIIKVLNIDYDRSDAALCFQQEFYIQQKLAKQTESVVQPIDLLRVSDTWAIVMEDFHGVSLHQIMHRPLDWHSFHKLALQLLDCLEQIHRCGVIHLDFQPQNIIVSDKLSQLKVTDFGQASCYPVVFQGKSLCSDRLRALAYQSPELTGWHSSPYVDYRSDYYSFGVILFQLLTGQLPHNADSWREGILFKLQNGISQPSLLEAGFSQQIWAIIKKLCDVFPDERYQSSAEIRKDLMACNSYLGGSTDKAELIEQKPIELGKSEQIFPFHVDLDLNIRESMAIAWQRYLQGRLRSINIRASKEADKTLAARSFAQNILSVQGLWLELVFDSGFQKEPLRLVKELIFQIADYYQNQAPSQSEILCDEIYKCLEDFLPELSAMVPEINDLLGYQGSRSSVTLPEAGQFDFHFNFVIAKLLELIAKHEKHVIIFLEDIHLADQTNLEFISYLIHQCEIPELLLLTSWQSQSDELLSDSIARALHGNCKQQYLSFLNLDGNTPDHESLLHVKNCSQPESESLDLNDDDYELLFYAAILGRAFSYRDLLQLLPTALLNRLSERVDSYIKAHILVPLENTHMRALFQTSEQRNTDSMPVPLLKHLFFTSSQLHQKILDIGKSRLDPYVVLASLRPNLNAEKQGGRLQYLLSELVFSFVDFFLKSGLDSEVAKVALKSGKSVFLSQDYKASSRYFQFLWQLAKQHKSTFKKEQYIEIASMLFMSLGLNRDKLGAEAVFQELVKAELSQAEKASLLYLKMCISERLGDYSAAVQAGFEALRLLDLHVLPEKQVKSSFLQETILFYKLKLHLKKMTAFQDNALLLQKPVKNCEEDLAYQIRSHLLRMSWNREEAGYWQQVLLAELCTLSKKYRLPSLYQTTVLAAWAHKNSLHDKGIYLKLHEALKLKTKHNTRDTSQQILLSASFVLHWWHSWRELTALFDQVIYLARVTNDIGLFAQALHQRLAFGVFESFELIHEKIVECFRFFSNQSHSSHLAVVILWQQKCKAYLSQTKSLASMDDENFIENDFLLANKDLSARTIYYLQKAELLYFSNQSEAAYTCLKQAATGIHLFAGQIYELNYCFLKALIVADIQRRQQLESHIASNILRKELRRMQRWARQNPFHLPMYYLMKAEKFAAKGISQAEGYFEKAAQLAKGQHGAMLNALIHERYASFQLRKDKKRLAQIIFQDALHYYELASAYAKVQALREELALNGLIETPAPHIAAKNPFRGNRFGSAGWTSLIRRDKEQVKLYELIEGLSKLPYEDRAERMLRYLLEQAMLYTGCEKALLIQKYQDSDELWVDSCILGRHLAEHSSGPVAEFGEQFSRRILDYVRQTGRVLHFCRADKDPIFCNDPYVITFDVRVIMCIPYFTSDGFRSALYLEKTLADERFSNDFNDMAKSMIALYHLFQMQDRAVSGRVPVCNTSLEASIAGQRKIA